MSKPTKKEFTPLINKKTFGGTKLDEKHVEIKGANSFGRSSNNLPVKPDAPIETTTSPDIRNKQQKERPDPRLAASKTAKMSPDVLLKINTLKPFIKDSEGIDKTSFNSIVDLLIENYVNTNLTVRQSEGYKQVYKQLFETLDK
ncbi:hypothetical protein [Bacillus toyonensis]|uniref:hypothetical protein n=1 Tax=Bacillus toyonensis TaxID=155322 RepID=UPI00027959DE|nr:hypothetical protein [Bacillus toyonensis]EJQ73039.1 hypothetical protein IGK_05486 [Bacillus toyonensis]HDR7320777.1 hypothetical protein [Bacillus toyonensis]HDR7395646.1 hypothetical protein [Bacillus toyonensis]HDR7483754.1 hypothetical protein [Bacillus toyonensis]HDR7844389.1 hypothetical protein [Bacillus toyonensis]